jgi:hypothetical protein
MMARTKGWLIDWAARRRFLTEAEELMLPQDGLLIRDDQPTNLLLYDEGERAAVKLKRGGWLMDGDGDRHRVRLLGAQEPVSNAVEFRCKICEACFQTRKCLDAHVSAVFADLGTQ